MNPKINFIIDVIMFILFLIVAFSERNVHHIAGVLLIIFIIIHVLIHWKTIFAMAKSFF